MFYSYPFESENVGSVQEPKYDRAITAEQERQFNKLRYTNGVFAQIANSLQVTSNNNMTTTIAPGGCHIEGALAYNTAPDIIQFEPANATLDRIDRVVMRFNLSTSVRSVLPYVKNGLAASNPQPPDLVRESNFFELCLADVKIRKGTTSITNTDITDQRFNSNLCGTVIPAIPTPIDMSDLYLQYQESLNQFLDIVAAALDGTLAGNLQNQIAALDARMGAEEQKVQPIDKGGTGATEIRQARKNLGVDISDETIQMFEDAGYPISGGVELDLILQALLRMAHVELLWENASAASSFPAQTIPLTLGSADLIVIDMGELGLSHIYKVGESAEIRGIQSSYLSARLATVTENGVEFGGGGHFARYNDSQSYVKGDNYCKPKRIYRITQQK